MACGRLAVVLARPILTVMHEPDRLADLRRQRALVQQHLDWLDREIAKERPGEDRYDAPAMPLPVRQKASPAPPTPPPTDLLLGEQPRPDSDVRRDVKKGCFLYFVAALGAIAFSVAILYFAFGVGRR